MLFASPLFLFVFLPMVIICYYGRKCLAGDGLRNSVLLLFSYLFYLFGAAGFVLLLAVSTLADYGLGLLIHRYRKRAGLWVFCSLLINLGLLFYFKYADFFVAEFNRAAAAWGMSGLGWPAVVLPIGISFFTFQKISYIVDVYRRNVPALFNLVDFALYVAMFPQLVAGPIVRFKDIRQQLTDRSESWEQFYTGVLRFCWGLAKKVLIADACGQIADAAFGLQGNLLDTKTAWLGALAYTLQIYFDFSAYSDMAIGLAALFGFELLENFQRPYAAVSLTDFWQRWHISLSRWFRDYLYIPLGGNRGGQLRTYFNLMVVFLLCGLWHGANWTFVLWGLYHGFFLVLERFTGLRRIPSDRWVAVRRTATLIVVVIGWVLFRSETLNAAGHYLHVMLVPLNRPLPFELYTVLNHRNVVFFGMACLSMLAAGQMPTGARIVRHHGVAGVALAIVLIILVLPYCAAFLVDGTDNPFIYFRF
jgi:alginate O-acetyltransferase complex protein AlgI